MPAPAPAPARRRTCICVQVSGGRRPSAQVSIWTARRDSGSEDKKKETPVSVRLCKCVCVCLCRCWPCTQLVIRGGREAETPDAGRLPPAPSSRPSHLLRSSDNASSSTHTRLRCRARGQVRKEHVFASQSRYDAVLTLRGRIAVPRARVGIGASEEGWLEGEGGTATPVAYLFNMPQQHALSHQPPPPSHFLTATLYFKDARRPAGAAAYYAFATSTASAAASAASGIAAVTPAALSCASVCTAARAASFSGMPRRSAAMYSNTNPKRSG